jgi:hypothetical protein
MRARPPLGHETAQTESHTGANIEVGGNMSPHRTFTRIPLQVGSELRIRNTGEVSVGNPTIETAPSQDAADAVLDYRFDPQTGEHVLRLLEPTSWKPRRKAR